MRKAIGFLAWFFLACAPFLRAGPGWEKDTVVSPSQSKQPFIRLKGDIPVVAYQKKEADGNYLHVISMRGGLFEKFFLGSEESFHEADMVFVTNRLYVVATGMREMLLLVKDPVTGAESRSVLSLSNTHGPILSFDPSSGLFHFFYVRIQKGRHQLSLLSVPQLTNARQFLDAKILVSEQNTNLRGSFFPRSVVDGKRMSVVFSKRIADGNKRTDSIHLISSLDNGSTWSVPQQISLPGKDSLFPSLEIVTQGKLVASFVQTGPENRSELVLAENPDQATARTVVFTNFAFPFYFPTVFQRQGRLRLMSYDYALNNNAVIQERTLDQTRMVWTDRTYVSPTNQTAFSYKHAHSGERSYVVWETPKGEIRFSENDVSVRKPTLFSSCVDTNFEYDGTAPEIQWKVEEDPSGIRGFAYILDMIPDSQPDIENLSGDILGKSFNSLADGTWYFHIRAIDGAGNWSDTSHFRFVINTAPLSPPIISSPSHKEFVPSQNTTVEMVWSMGAERRKIKGYSYLFTTREDVEPEEKIMTQATNMQFYNIKPGVWRFTIKACDTEGRWSPFSQYMVNIEETILAASAADFKKMPKKDFFEQESAITYTVQKGDILSRIINKILGLKPHQDYKDYLKDIVKYNDIQNPDNIQPDTKVMIPVLISDQETDLETVAEAIFGTPKAKYKIVIQNSDSTNQVKIGDRLLIRDKYFLKTGSLRKKEEEGIRESGLKIRTESENMAVPTSPETNRSR